MGSKSRRLDTIVSSVQTGWRLLRNRRRYRHAFWFNNANLPGIVMTLLGRIPMTVNTDGLEWRRAKWSWPFKAYYYLSSWLISLLCRSLIVDSRGVGDYYRRRFARRGNFIPYGTTCVPEMRVRDQQMVLGQYGLQPGRYFLQITRLEPDNLPLRIAAAFRNSGLAERGFSMVCVGYKESTPYADSLLALNGRNGIQVNKAVYDQQVLCALRKNCFCYVHGNLVGGTNPALLEAMATCPRVMAVDCEFSREVLGATGLFFDRNDIEATFREVVLCEDHSTQLQQRVGSRYQWDAVADAYRRLAEGRAAEYERSLMPYTKDWDSTREAPLMQETVPP